MRGCRDDAEAVQQVLQDLGIRWAASLLTVDTSSRPSEQSRRRAPQVGHRGEGLESEEEKAFYGRPGTGSTHL